MRNDDNDFSVLALAHLLNNVFFPVSARNSGIIQDLTLAQLRRC